MTNRKNPLFTTEERINLEVSPLSSLRIVNNTNLELIYKDQIEVSLAEMEELQRSLDLIASERSLKNLVILGKDTTFSNEA
jgi:hypothetical protein